MIGSTFRLTKAEAEDLRARFGTPLYVLDEAHFRSRIREYRSALAESWESTSLSYATKANSHLAANRIAWQEGCHLDAASEGEIEAALRAGAPPQAINLHGNNKSKQEIERALELGIRRIVIDSFEEIDYLAGRAAERPTAYSLRLAPGVDPHTHAHICTGSADTKFGFGIHDGSADRALAAALEAGLPIDGFHAHVGSQLLDPEAQMQGAAAIAGFARRAASRYGIPIRELSVGGGLGVRYTAEDPEPTPIREYVCGVASAVREAWGGEENFELVHEPGRALVACAGATLYTVGGIKRVTLEGGRTRRYVSVDGGLADNPRPGLYDARYTVEALRDGSAAPATVCGRHCESDILIQDALLPEDASAGDLVQVLATGAYNHSMSSNYNRYPRPAMALRRMDGSFDLVQRPETWDELFSCESIPDDL